MSDDRDFVSRWSRRKIAARTGAPEEAKPAPPAASLQDGAPLPAQEAAPLPPVESLTLESDFTPFMKSDVDPGVKREALKVLMRDPRFNVMDGLDVYIADYSQPDPLPPEWLGQLNMMKRLGNFVEEPEKEAAAQAAGDADGLPKAMQEQPVAFPENKAPADTSKSDSAAVKVDNSGNERV